MVRALLEMSPRPRLHSVHTTLTEHPNASAGYTMPFPS
jgi:hypothetical protein